MTSQVEFQEQIKKELRNALAYFLERQKLVAQAMIELGLDLDEIAEYGGLAWSSSLHSTNGEVQNAVDFFAKYEESENNEMQKMYELAKRASEKKVSQSGIWRDNGQNEWRYFLHGKGCRLTNLKTGEPIDWDCPDVNSYDRYKFLNHLIWQLSSPERTGKLISTYNLVSHSLVPLINEIKNENL